MEFYRYDTKDRLPTSTLGRVLPLTVGHFFVFTSTALHITTTFKAQDVVWPFEKCLLAFFRSRTREDRSISVASLCVS